MTERRPTIHIHPQSREVVVGERLVLRCCATGSPLPHYLWRHNGHAISHNGGESQLVIMPVSASHGGVYQCEVYNNVGDPVLSNSATVKAIIRMFQSFIPSVSPIFSFSLSLPTIFISVSLPIPLDSHPCISVSLSLLSLYLPLSLSFVSPSVSSS